MMKCNIDRTLFALALATVFTACGPSAGKTDVSAGDTITAPAVKTEEPLTGSTEAFADFDWTAIPTSSASIGAFPYLTAPAGFFIQDKGGWEESKTGYSLLQDFNKLIIYDGKSFYNAEGKVAKLKFSMKQKDTDWNQYNFDRSVDGYLNTIGAKPLGTIKITDAQKAFLNKDNDMTIYNHIVGDPYNEPVRCFALNHAEGKIMFQVFSNSASGEVAVVQLAGFEQTIKAPTAVQMKKDIDDKGKAILNINFDTDKATLQAEGQKAVDEILTLLTSNPELSISIEGHTDNSGTAQRNKQLSGERANTILNFLTGKGISAKRLSATGYGAEKPLAANDSEENMAKNRRVELVKK